MNSLRARVEHAVPRVPNAPGELAWVVARAEQVLEIVRASSTSVVTELWVQLHPDTLARVAAVCSNLTIDPLPGVSAMAPVVLRGETVTMYLVADAELDRASLVMSLTADDTAVEIATSAVLGFVYPTPVRADEIDTRWTLQHDDGMDGDVADNASRAL